MALELPSSRRNSKKKLQTEETDSGGRLKGKDKQERYLETGTSKGLGLSELKRLTGFLTGNRLLRKYSRHRNLIGDAS